MKMAEEFEEVKKVKKVKERGECFFFVVVVVVVPNLFSKPWEGVPQ